MTTDLALRWTLSFASIAIVLNSAELLVVRRAFASGGLIGLRAPLKPGLMETALAGAPSPWTAPPLLTPLLIGRLLFAGWLITSAITGASLGVPVALCFAASVTVAWLKVVGGDGADQMALCILTASALGYTLGQNTPPAQRAVLVFIAGQSLLAYVTAGAAKLASSRWRRGGVLAGIISTSSYGTPFVGRFLARFPLLDRLLGWIAIAFEMTMPLVLFLPFHLAVPLLACGVLFHLSCAFVMGLNDFVWAFIATYPALLYSRELLASLAA